MYFKVEVYYDEPTEAIFMIAAKDETEVVDKLSEFFGDKVKNFKIVTLEQPSEEEVSELELSLSARGKALN